LTDLLPVSERRALQRTERRTDPAVDRDIGAAVEQRARVVLDTSVLIADPDCFSAFEAVDIVVPLTVIEELDGLKTRIDDVGRAARAALRGIEELRVSNGGSLAHPVQLGTSTLQIEINGIQKHRLLEHGLDRRRTERDDAGARLELGEEQHLVDELRDLVDLAARLLDERGNVLAGQGRRLEERQQSGERGAQLVRDSCGESRPELLVRREVTFAREIDEALPPAGDLVGDDEGDDPALAREEVGRQRLTLAQAVDGLACPPTRVEHAVAVVDHDDRLPALLDEHSPASGIGVRHVTAF